MSDRIRPVLPLRVGALLTVSPSVRVRVSARADALQIRAPFGSLTVPYALITRATREPDAGVRLDMAGATVHLHLGGVPDVAVNVLFDLLNQETRPGGS